MLAAETKNRILPTRLIAQVRPQFGRVPVWFEESAPSLAAALALATVAFAILFMITTRPKRPPVAIATVAMQPVASDVHGLQGGSPGEATSDKELQPEHQPLIDSIEWINSVDSGGGTDPRPALTKALEVHPETIYVLSDGLFEAACVTEVKKANHGLNRATIYTVGFGDRTGEAQLTRLAKDSGGQYRFVEPDQ